MFQCLVFVYPYCTYCIFITNAMPHSGGSSIYLVNTAPSVVATLEYGATIDFENSLDIVFKS